MDAQRHPFSFGKGETKYSCENGGAHPLCSTYVSAYNDAYNNDDISGFIWDDDLKQGVIEDEMEYNYFIFETSCLNKK